MPSVFTIEGSDLDRAGKRGEKCKRVTNKRTGCSTLLCYTGRGRTGWTFQKNTTICPGGKKSRANKEKSAMRNNGLGEGLAASHDEYGEVDLFGLDEFGQPAGVNPLWGGVGGALLQTGSAIGVRALSDKDSGWHEWAEAIGAGVGIAAGGVMAIFRGTRAAGWTAMAVSLVNGGLRVLERALTKDEAKAEAKPEGVGITTVEPAMIPRAGYSGALGYPVVEAAQIPSAGYPGALGAALPQLVGSNQMPTLVGGMELSKRYGTTVMG